MPSGKFPLSAILASNRYFTVERRGEIDALSCYVSYRVQRDLYDLCRENGWFRDLPWAEFVLLMRANKSARNAAIVVIFDTLSSFFANEHYDFDAVGVSMIYGGEGEVVSKPCRWYNEKKNSMEVGEIMEFITGKERGQYYMGCLDDSIDENNPVRFVDAYVSQLDVSELGFESSTPQETGRPAYSPKDMLKLYIYGYLNRVRSSRGLEKECYRNIEVIWLIKGLRPDHKTIARFRQINPKALKKVFQDFVRLCMRLDLMGKEMIAVDGSKFKAWNSKDRNYTKGKLDDRIGRIEEKIAAYLEELDKLDAAAKSESQLESKRSSKSLQETISILAERKAVLEEYRERVSCGEETQVSLTDPDSRLMKTKDGMAVCLNIQTAVDSKNKLVVEFEVGNQVQDKNLMSPMAKKASEILETEHMVIVADNGYDSVSDVAQVLAGKNIPVVAGGDYEFWYPTAEEEAEKVTDYDETIARPVYLPERNVYICPMGKFLYPSCYTKSKHIAKYANTRECSRCTKKCTSMKYYYAERRMNRSEFSKEYDASPVPLKKIRVLQNKEIAAQRKCIVEHPFGTIKRDMGIAYLLLRTIPKAEGELSLAFLAFNIKRALNIVGIQKLLAVLV